MQALMAMMGFKPYSHEATIAFAKEYYPNQIKFKIISDMDGLRRIRNDIKYRAKAVTVDDATESLILSEQIIKQAEKIVASME